MPSDGHGGYTPLTQAQKTEGMNYAQNLVRQGGLTNSQILYKIGARIPGVDQYDQGALLNIIQGAHRTVEAANLATQSHGQPPDPSTIPLTPRQPEERGQYIYDVLILVTDPRTGEQYGNREEMVVSQPISVDDIIAEVMANRDRYIHGPTSPFPPEGFTSDPTITVQVLDVGRGTAPQ